MGRKGEKTGENEEQVCVEGEQSTQTVRQVVAVCVYNSPGVAARVSGSM